MDIFVYGTLQSAKLRKAVAGGDPLVTVPARLCDYAVLPVAGNVVPLIRATAGSITNGILLSGISQAQLVRLDAYEGAFGYHLIDVTVQTDAGPQTVKMYLPPDDIIAGQGDWSFEDWTVGHEGVAVLAANELFAYQPPLGHESIRRRWHMIEKRAWAKWRSSRQVQSLSLRHHAQPDDVSIVSAEPPAGDFFALQALKMHHQQFNGTRSAVLPREIFVGIDAAMVLPYDPKRDRVLLVEQIRMGPIVRQDPQPWTLEPIAGMVDARETPQDAARRESVEEAGLTDLDLIHISSFYPSPGSSTDYFYAFAGICELPDDHFTFGGLEEEAEDLRLHLVSFDDAMAMVTSGELNAGPLVMMLFWLATQRDALRGLR